MSMVAPTKVSRKEFEAFRGVRWNAMNSICALSKIDELTPIQRIAHLAFWYMSEVYNGGHYQYFVNKCRYDHQEVLRCVREVGATEQAAILEKALEYDPSKHGDYPDDVNEFVEGSQDIELSKLN